MITIERQQEFFIRISHTLQQPITMYAIGGTAMMFLALKEETLDIDLVFINEKDRELFREAARSLSQGEIDARTVYGARPHTPIMVTIEDARIDLFTRNVLGVQFSDAMIQRAVQIHEFGRNLLIHPADIHDILIMKSATSRLKDENDILALLKSPELKWDVLLSEVENQVKLGNEKANLNLGLTLEKFMNKGKAVIPKEILDKLWNMLQKQVKDKAKKQTSQSKRS